MTTISLTKRQAAYGSAKTHNSISALSNSDSLLLIAAMFVLGTGIALASGIPIRNVMENYSYDVLVILIVMELFTNLIAETGIMQLIAIKIAEFSQGQQRLCLILFGAMMFLISSCLNNITAVMMILPVVFVLLKTLEVDKRYVCSFFAVILALSNTGGAASPVGDFPAIVLMTSGITGLLSYLTHAFPFTERNGDVPEDLIPQHDDLYLRWLRDRLEVIPTVYEQQKKMYETNRTHVRTASSACINPMFVRSPESSVQTAQSLAKSFIF